MLWVHIVLDIGVQQVHIIPIETGMTDMTYQPAMTTDQTLTQVLAGLGVRHTPSKHFNCRDLYLGDRFIDAYDVVMGWKFARRETIKRSVAA